ncbi:MAG: N-acetyltransferase [Candidatus Methanomethyliaceae archaeon]|nr:N-acetyltransferase [Candidatus Methanomethyliaceae archaeon]
MSVKIEDEKIVVDLGGSEAFLKYHVKKDKMYIDATFTPEEHRGKGIGAKMMEAAINYAREKKLKIVPVCPFSVEFFKKHPEYKNMLAG